MDLRDIPVVGSAIALLGTGLDLILNSGDIVIHLLIVVGTDPGAVLGIVSILNRLASRVPWLPKGLLGQVMTTLLVASLVIAVARLIKRRRANA